MLIGLWWIASLLVVPLHEVQELLKPNLALSWDIKLSHNRSCLCISDALSHVHHHYFEFLEIESSFSIPVEYIEHVFKLLSWVWSFEFLRHQFKEFLEFHDSIAVHIHLSNHFH